MQANTDVKTLKAKLALNGTGPYTVLAVGPCSSADTPDSFPYGDNLYVDLVSDLFGSDTRRLVAIERCKPYDKHPRKQWHAQLPTDGTDSVCAQQRFQETPPYDVT